VPELCFQATAVVPRNCVWQTAHHLFNLTETRLTKVLILYYSSYGHTERMADAIAEGVLDLPGTIAVVKRVPELVPTEIAQASHFKLTQHAPVASVDELADFDAIVVGVPTRFGRMPAQMANFLDQAGGLWFKDKLVGKVGSVFVSVGSQHGGHETTSLGLIANLLHLGMTIVGVPYSEKRLLQTNEISGGGPLGATTVAGADGARSPSENELAIARAQGRHVAKVAQAQRALMAEVG